VNSLAQFVFDLGLQARERGHRPFGLAPAMEILRKALVATRDPTVLYDLVGFRLELPFSHELPYYRIVYPDYATNIARLARSVDEKYPGATVVDIGANVGDTAALIRSASTAPILCIEGDPVFFEILERNAARIPGLHLAQVLVAGAATEVHAALTTGHGTGRVMTGGQSTLRFEAVESILSRWSSLPAPKLIKIDTDGYDCEIISGSAAVWERLKPTLFFEYDPAFLPPTFDTNRFFGQLADVGYDRLFVYDNIGEFILSLPMAQRAAIEDLHYYYSGRGSARYADLAIFHRDDADLAERFRLSELAHFAQARLTSK
jgi:FkbM family methyltransferase